MTDISTLSARKALAAKYGAKHGLDAVLVASVCEQESWWNPWAIRFEPAFEARYIKPALNYKKIKNRFRNGWQKGGSRFPSDFRNCYGRPPRAAFVLRRSHQHREAKESTTR